MQLFMLLAGFFAELVLQRKGMNHLIKDRALNESYCLF